MGFRFHKSVKIAPGVKLNLGKKSAGISIGGKLGGISFNSKTGTHARVSAPGTGISYSEKMGGQSKSASKRPFQKKNAHMDLSGGASGANKPRKPFYKRWWFAAIIAVCVIGTIGNLAGGNDKTKASVSSPSVRTEQNAEVKSPSEAKTPTETNAPSETNTPAQAGAPAGEEPPHTADQQQESTSVSTSANSDNPVAQSNSQDSPSADSSSAAAQTTPAAAPGQTAATGQTPAAEQPQAVSGGSATISTAEGRFVASSQSDKYHSPDCRFAKKILEVNAIWFDSVDEARAAGYSPCGVCYPG